MDGHQGESPVDFFKIKGSYFMGDHDTDAANLAGTDLDESDTKTSMLALGLDHIAAKNVKFYLQWVMVTNGDVTAAGLAGTNFADPGDPAERGYANGHGTWTPAAAKDNGALENPMGFSLGTVINF